MAFPFVALIVGVILIVSTLFLTRSKIGAIIFSIVDLSVGLLLISSKAIPASLVFLNVPEIVTLYAGAFLTFKGIYYLVISIR